MEMSVARLVTEGSSKAQLMSLTALLILILILAELFSFVFIDIQYNNIAQSSTLSEASINLAGSLRQNAAQFGSASASEALAVLSYYEYNATLRKGNFISNTGIYLRYLMTNGTLPGVPVGSPPANYLSSAMHGYTFKSYNLLTLSNFSKDGLYSIAENSLNITQQSPYSINVSYVENININYSSIVSQYSIPVKFSVSLNGTPDLYYAQEGVLHYINFANLTGITSLTAGTYANSGSQYNFAYGTVYYYSGSTCPSLSSGVANTIILVMPNTGSLSGCENSFAGFITNSSMTTSPNVPYLIYSQNVILSNYFITGAGVLLYGPQLSAINVEALRQAISNGYYFASPLAPSYLSRSQGTFNSSTAGLFTFSGYGSQTASFNGLNSYVDENTVSGNLKVPVSTTGITISAWIRPQSVKTLSSILSTSGGCGYSVAITSNSINSSDGCGDTYNAIFNFMPQTWVNVAVTVPSGSTPTASVYINGNQMAHGTTSTWQSASSWSSLYIGSNGIAQYFGGSIANVQIYNESLSAAQLKQEYARGMLGVPASNSGLVGWFELDGNTYDGSGQSSSGYSSNVAYPILSYGTPSISPIYLSGSNSLVNLYTLSKNAQVSVQSTGLSISAWFKLPVLPGVNNGIVSTYGGCGYGLVFGSSTSLAFSDNCGHSYSASYTFLPNVWYNVVATASSGSTTTETFYINGNQISQGTASGWSAFSSTGAYLGYSSSGNYLNGYLSDVQIYNTTLTSTQANQLYYAGIGGAPRSFSNLVGWFKLDGNVNDYTQGSIGNVLKAAFIPINGSARDSILQNYSGDTQPLPGVLSCINIASCYNASLPNLYLGNLNLEPGGLSQVSYFNTQNSFAETQAAPTSTNTLTVSAWVLPYATGGDRGIMGQGDFGSGYWELKVFGSSYDFATYTVKDNLFSGAVTTGVWDFLTATYYNGNVNLYLNGNPAGTDTESGSLTTNAPLYIGYAPKDTTPFFNGMISNVQIYSSALTQNQIGALYNEGISGAPIPNNGILTWMPLEGNCKDYSGNGNSCVVQNNVTYPLFTGNYVSPSSPGGMENEWQALGLGSIPA